MEDEAEMEKRSERDEDFDREAVISQKQSSKGKFGGVAKVCVGNHSTRTLGG